MSIIPPELIINILSYLPVRSLCRFRCVSKSWFALITHPRFIKRHLDQPRKNNLLLSKAYLYLVDLKKSLEQKSNKVNPIKLDQFKENPNKAHPINPDQLEQCVFVLFGSSNGLFCIRPDPDDVFFVYNPSTRESRKIPDFIPVKNNYRTLYGFGYNESIDDYKFVKVISEKLLHIFSLRNNSWKNVEGNFRLGFPCLRAGVCFNGAIHWSAHCSRENPAVITIFDLAEEKFRTLPLPTFPNPPRRYSCKVVVLGKYLCVLFQTESDSKTEFFEIEKGFWIMKEYGVQESWTRIVISHDPFYPYLPVCFWENNEIILSSDFGERLICYEEDGKVRTELVFDRGYDMYSYEESLIPPDYNLDFTTQENPGYFVI